MNVSDLAVAVVSAVLSGVLAWLVARTTTRTALRRERERLAEGRQFNALDALSSQIGKVREECFRDVSHAPPTPALRDAFVARRWNGYQLYIDPVVRLSGDVTTLAMAMSDRELGRLAASLEDLADVGAKDCYNQGVQDAIGKALEALSSAVTERKAARMQVLAG